MTVLRPAAAVFFLMCASNCSMAQQFPHFTHGPILGRLSEHGIGVWARTEQPREFRVRYGESADALTRTSPVVKTRLENDNTGWVHIQGLQANTRYYYTLEIPGAATATHRRGTFRTLPESKDFVDDKLNPKGLFNFSFEYGCGNNQNPGQSAGPSTPTFRTMTDRISQDIHFAILNGDWLYETRRSYSVPQWLAQVNRPAAHTPQPVKVAPALVGVWQNYKHFLEQSNSLNDWHRVMPTFFTYDDHEILNDVWGAGSPGLRDRRAVFRDVGVKAWYDYLGWSNPTEFPQRVHFGRAKMKAGSFTLTDDDADFTKLDLSQANNLHVHWGSSTDGVNENALDGVGGIANAGVYGITSKLGKHQLKLSHAAKEDAEVSYSIGRRSYFRRRISNCDFFFTDTRGQRQMHDTRNPAKPGLSMLGPVQRKWLMDGVASSDADFIFVISSVNFMVPHVGGGIVRGENKDDAWTVFLDEREKLIKAWDKLDKPVLVLTGDLHNSFAIKITDNVWELASGPHNSRNHLARDEGDRRANGKFKYGPREVDIRWSTYFHSDIPRANLLSPGYCVVQVNNVFNNPVEANKERWAAYPRPQVIFQFYDGRTGKLRYAESILAAPKKGARK